MDAHDGLGQPGMLDQAVRRRTVPSGVRLPTTLIIKGGVSRCRTGRTARGGAHAADQLIAPAENASALPRRGDARVKFRFDDLCPRGIGQFSPS